MYSNKMLMTITAFVNTCYKVSRFREKLQKRKYGEVMRSGAPRPLIFFIARNDNRDKRESGRAPTRSLQREVLFLSSLCYHSTPNNPCDAFTVTDTELLLKSHMMSCWALFMWTQTLQSRTVCLPRVTVHPGARP